jgi:hypothetical protein
MKLARLHIIRCYVCEGDFESSNKGNHLCLDCEQEVPKELWRFYRSMGIDWTNDKHLFDFFRGILFKNKPKNKCKLSPLEKELIKARILLFKLKKHKLPKNKSGSWMKKAKERVGVKEISKEVEEKIWEPVNKLKKKYEMGKNQHSREIEIF